jgi:hypothetical protein
MTMIKRSIDLMKAPVRKIFCLSAFIVFVLCCGCKKNVPGPKGEPGTPGLPGNLKQTTVGPFKLDSMSWTFDGFTWNNELYVAEVNETVIARGEVRVYMSVDGQWRSLPYAVGNEFTQLKLRSNYVHLYREKIHDGVPLRPVNTNFRFVIFQPAN